MRKIYELHKPVLQTYIQESQIKYVLIEHSKKNNVHLCAFMYVHRYRNILIEAVLCDHFYMIL